MMYVIMCYVTNVDCWVDASLEPRIKAGDVSRLLPPSVLQKATLVPPNWGFLISIPQMIYIILTRIKSIKWLSSFGLIWTVLVNVYRPHRIMNVSLLVRMMSKTIERLKSHIQKIKAKYGNIVCFGVDLQLWIWDFEVKERS